MFAVVIVSDQQGAKEHRKNVSSTFFSLSRGKAVKNDNISNPLITARASKKMMSFRDFFNSRVKLIRREILEGHAV